MKSLLGLISLCLCLLVLILGGRALLTEVPQVAPAPVKAVPLDQGRLAKNLSAAVQLPTISEQGNGGSPQTELRPFFELHDLLAKLYPRVHALFPPTTLGEASLVYHWPGTDPSLKPVLLLAHQDVVPVPESELPKWTHPPFSGTISDGFIWGRGTLDFKFGIIAILEACEKLLSEGFAPRRSLYLAFGHDEEVMGTYGARLIAAHFEKEGLQFEFVLDEGLPITHNMMPGLESPLALIALAEKGYTTVELRTNAPSGHSSMPPPHTAIGTLSRAITRLENTPIKARLTAPTEALFETAGPFFPLGHRLLFANLWLFEPILLNQLTGKTGTNALVRTTGATTLINGGIKENVLPTEASALVNFRLLPGDSLETVVAHVTEAIDDPSVSVRSRGGQEASSVSCHRCPAYQRIATTIRQVFPDVLVAPSITVGATDARYYTSVSSRVYRFAPQHIGPEDRSRFHGINERIKVDHFADAVRFYRQLVINVNSPSP